MKSKLMRVAFVAVAAAAAPAVAGEPASKSNGEEPRSVAPATQAPAEHSQQSKMKTCNVKAAEKSLKGDERRAFMSACLKG